MVDMSVVEVLLCTNKYFLKLQFSKSALHLSSILHFSMSTLKSMW